MKTWNINKVYHRDIFKLMKVGDVLKGDRHKQIIVSKDTEFVYANNGSRYFLQNLGSYYLIAYVLN